MNATCQFHVDQPTNWSRLAPGLIVRGWCFAASGPAVTGIRLRVGGLTLAGITGLPRPDVKLALPTAPDDHTGFEIRGLLPAGTHPLTLEVLTNGGCWHVLLQATTRVQ